MPILKIINEDGITLSEIAIIDDLDLQKLIDAATDIILEHNNYRMYVIGD